MTLITRSPYSLNSYGRYKNNPDNTANYSTIELEDQASHPWEPQSYSYQKSTECILCTSVIEDCVKIFIEIVISASHRQNDWSHVRKESTFRNGPEIRISPVRCVREGCLEDYLPNSMRTPRVCSDTFRIGPVRPWFSWAKWIGLRLSYLDQFVISPWNDLLIYPRSKKKTDENISYRGTFSKVL